MVITLKLKFLFGNSKVSNSIATFSLPAGYTCPFALLCLSKANKTTGKLTDGPHTLYRCFSASTEALYKNTRDARWYNLDLLKNLNLEDMIELIHQSVPSNIIYVRVHVSGDFYSEQYFLAWLNVALNNPNKIFYAYTKDIPSWIKYRKQIPSNFRLTASLGGTHDHLVFKYKLKYARVVFSEAEARHDGLEIDHDDSHAYSTDQTPFALLLHGIQPAGSIASDALKQIKKESNFTGYSTQTKSKIYIK